MNRNETDSINKGTPVWVRILGNNSDTPSGRPVNSDFPETWAPGIVTDATVGPRVRIRSGKPSLHIDESMTVVSYRTIPGRNPFYAEGPEAIASLSLRAEQLPVIDGDGSEDKNSLISRLRAKASIGKAPDADQRKALIDALKSAPAI